MPINISLSKIFSIILNFAIETKKDINIETLEDQSIVIAIDELYQDIAIAIKKNKVIAIYDEEVINADVKISGNLKAVVNMIRDEDTGIESHELLITGKLRTAKKFQHLLSELSINWQSLFEKITSPEKASKIAETIEQTISFAKGSKDKLTDKLKIYLIEEKKIFVEKEDFEQYKNDLAQFNKKLTTLIEKIESIS